MITEKDKKLILQAFKQVDVKKLQLDHPNPNAVKWFRFGSHVGLDIAAEVVKSLPEKNTEKKLDKSMSGKVS